MVSMRRLLLKFICLWTTRWTTMVKDVDRDWWWPLCEDTTWNKFEALFLRNTSDIYRIRFSQFSFACWLLNSEEKWIRARSCATHCFAMKLLWDLAGNAWLTQWIKAKFGSPECRSLSRGSQVCYRSRPPRFWRSDLPKNQNSLLPEQPDKTSNMTDWKRNVKNRLKLREAASCRLHFRLLCRDVKKSIAFQRLHFSDLSVSWNCR